MKRNGRYRKQLNILIYVKDPQILWEYRKKFYQIKGKVPCKMHVKITDNIEHVWDTVTLLSGKIDIFLIDISFADTFVKELDYKLQSYGFLDYHIIVKKQKGYVDIRRIDINMTCIDHWEDKNGEFEKEIFRLILNIQST